MSENKNNYINKEGNSKNDVEYSLIHKELLEIVWRWH
jgi:hypothetical protein